MLAFLSASFRRYFVNFWQTVSWCLASKNEINFLLGNNVHKLTEIFQV